MIRALKIVGSDAERRRPVLAKRYNDFNAFTDKKMDEKLIYSTETHTLAA